MNAYSLIKSLHLLFVIAWLASVFYLPRILVNLAEAGDHPQVRDRLLLMGQRLYRFGHHMFGIAFVFGTLLWLGHRFIASLPDVVHGGWLHAKLLLLAWLFAYYIISGRMLRAIAAGGKPRTPTWLRWYNELPVLLTLAVIWLVIAKPF